MTGGVRVRAPELRGRGGWINTGGRTLSLAQLRGKFVLLDFWTFCCANCLHVINELRPLETRFADVLVVIGVHSPKFAHETEHAAVAAAVERYEVDHAVLDDPDLNLWRQYAVRAWPTLVLIDPEGYVVAQATGEGQVSGLARMIDALTAEHEARKTLHRGAGPYVPPAPPSTLLRYPAKAVLLPSSRTGRERDSLLVADAGHHQLVELDVDGVRVLRRIGTGERGRDDGAPPSFSEPGGVALLPAGAADFDVIVADTGQHLLRGLRLSDGAVVRSVDLGAELAGVRTVPGAIAPVLSPWDVAWWPALDAVVVAAAGVHLLLSWRTDEGTRLLAGTTVEGLRDGPAASGWLAQPSGLAVDGDRLWFVDAETSALRSLDLGPAGGEPMLRTWVGEGLFDFGHVDGPAERARLQHPLGVTLLPDRSVAMLDTYNGAVRHFDPLTAEVTTLATGLAEPSGAVLVDGELVVVESGAHRLVRAVPKAELRSAESMTTARPVTVLAPGAVRLSVRFVPPPGRKPDERYGPATRLSIGASPAGVLVDGAGDSVDLVRELRLAEPSGPIDAEDDRRPAVLHVTAQAAACDADGNAAHPACYVSRQDWGVPIEIRPDGARELELVLLG
ncbi:MAG: redoxin domain-containing protein [Actinobacteria bacterium]|nr:redoxin domain-containing protein [Actinomycetota bacterium]